ncbi:MAG: hypothetical protein F4Y44_06410 [Chloroflexi bacterium]|nr:hypothetical protein [Chloroflexota bacterium]
MLKAIAAAVVIGVVCGLWLALVNGSVEIFQNYVDGAWRYQLAVHSFAEILVGVVVGALAGANIRLGLASQRADGFALGALIGVVVGIALSLAQVIIVILAVQMREYDTDYNFLLTRFSGIIGSAALLGGANGLLIGGRLRISASSGAVIGALTAAAFALPVIIVALTVLVSGWSISPAWVFTSTFTYALPQLPVLIAGAGIGAIIGAVCKQRAMDGANSAPVAIGVLLGATAAVTASSLSFHYVILGLNSSASSFSIALFAFRALLGMVVGGVGGLLIITAMRRTASSRRADTDTVSRD